MDLHRNRLPVSGLPPNFDSLLVVCVPMSQTAKVEQVWAIFEEPLGRQRGEAARKKVQITKFLEETKEGKKMSIISFEGNLGTGIHHATTTTRYLFPYIGSVFSGKVTDE